MTRDPGNTLRNAQQINLTAISKRFNNTVNPTDQLDLYRFKVGDRSYFNLNLKGLQANANAALLNQQGRVIFASKRPGRKAETIEAFLNSGVYYIRIAPQGKASTRYQLVTSATPIPSNPNLTVTRGAIAPFTGNLLQVATQPSGTLVYTLTEQPQNGRLQLNGQVLKVGSSFTQDDIDQGRLSYRSIGKVQLTNNTTLDGAPFVDGSKIVWTGFDGNDYEIYLYDFLTDTTTALTNNSTADQFARISGDYVAWNANDGQDDELVLHNLKTGVTIPITNNNQIQDRLFAMSGNNLLWGATDQQNSSTTLMLYDGSTGTSIPLKTDNFLGSSIGLSIAGNKVAWIDYKDNLDQPDDATEEVFFYDGVITRPLTNNTSFESTPRVFGSGVVWMGFDGNDYEIYRFDGNTTQPLTQNDSNDVEVTVFGNKIAWMGLTNGKSDVFVYDGQTTTQITNTPISEYGIRLSDSAIAWESDPTFDTTSIYFYDGVNTTPLVNAGLRNGLSNLSGSTVTWTNLTANGSEVFFYNGARSDRFSFTASNGVGSSVSSTFNITITE